MMRHLITIVSVLALLPMAAAAGSPLSKTQTSLIEGRLSAQFQMTRLQAEEEAARRLDYLDTAGTGPFQALARAAAQKHRIPVGLFAKLVQTESNWQPRAQSHAGAIGLAQLMPQTARILGVDPWNPAQNLDGGARYLRQQYQRFGTWRLALAAYNAGPEAVEKYRGVPPYAETRAYVKKILGN